VPTIEPLNTIPIQQFLQQVKSAEASKAKELRMPIDQCKNLAFTLGIVMSRLHGDLEKLVANSKDSDDSLIQINMDAGSGWK